MSNPITIRRFRAKDMERILAIEASVFASDAYDRNLFAEFFHKCGELFLVAEGRGRRVCGYMLTCKRGQSAEVVSIAVDPEFQRRGVASKLMDSALRRLKRRGILRLSLMVKVTNDGAKAFYERYAFERVRVVRGYYEDGADGLLMKKTSGW